MRTSRYDEKPFWEGIFGRGNGVDVLWKRYRSSLEGEVAAVVEAEPKEETANLPLPDDVSASDVKDTDTDEDDGAVLVEKEDSAPEGMGGSVRRRPSK